ncbi:cdc42 homolog [Clytia hemisphaerica]|uniref:cdc42 homolog n=1 Tax=Clytia hemisphaerica TaxID=252671 RepID=UPI0034D5638F
MSDTEKEIEDEKIQLKRVFFGGDGAVGKTSMFLYYFAEKKPNLKHEYIPSTVSDANGSKIYTYKNTGEKIRIYYIDWGVGKDWERTSHLGYKGAAAVVLCFSIGSRSSFENIEEYWYPFMKKYASKAPIVLCGTKTDMRTDELAKHNQKPITNVEGKKLAQKIKAVGYFECSSVEGRGVKELFDAAAEATHPDITKTKSEECSVM